jgi:predicted kinase
MPNEQMFPGSLILLRGLPGSGKTEFAELISENGKYPVFSVDDYFTNSDTGEYSFIYDKNHLAYKSCIDKTEAALKNKLLKVIVHNTFTMLWELEPYFKLASENRYKLFVLTVEKYHAGKNNHGVTDEQLRKMAEKYSVKLY